MSPTGARRHYPADLAVRVYSVLSERGLSSPSLEALTYLLEELFHLSLQHEESRPIRLRVVYMDPMNPDPDPPGRIVHDRWEVVRLEKPIPLRVATLTKLGPAVDPRTAACAVHDGGSGDWYVWGLIDQEIRAHEYMHHESTEGAQRPGLFSVTIEDVGYLSASIEYAQIAELRDGTLLGPAHDVFFAKTPVYDKLFPGMDRHIERLSSLVPQVLLNEVDQQLWPSAWGSEWIRSLVRVLGRIRRKGHGGSLIVTRDRSLSGLNPKYRLTYHRLQRALEEEAVHACHRWDANNRFFELADDEGHRGWIPTPVHLDVVVEESKRAECRRELDGAIWFVAGLAQVDGAVVLDQDLRVLAFGAEITYEQPPRNLCRALNPAATAVEPAVYEHFGTRHRSMFRYVEAVSDAVGFIVSQDGSVKAVVKTKDTVVFWSEILLRLGPEEEPARNEPGQ